MLNTYFFAVVACFLLFKLYKTLGSIDKSQARKSGVSNIILQDDLDESKDIDIVSKAEASLSQGIRDSFDTLRCFAPQFHAEYFIKGVKKAFPLILEKLDQGDKKVLSQLLGKELYSSFGKEIKRRKEANLLCKTSVIGIKSVEIVAAKIIQNSKAQINVTILSEQIKVTENEKGEAVEGNINNILTLTDHWIFESKLSNTLTWKLISAS